MKRSILLSLVILSMFFYKSHAKEVTVCEPYVKNECTTESEEYTVHHEEETTYSNWRKVGFCYPLSDVCKFEREGRHGNYYSRNKEVIPAWDEVLYKDVENCKDVNYSSCSVHKSFTEDKRCLDTKPINVTWSRFMNGTLTWSAEGGDKVEVKFGYDANDLKYTLLLTNDGHEKINSWWGGYWKLRTVNGCKYSNWSPVLHGIGSW